MVKLDSAARLHESYVRHLGPCSGLLAICLIQKGVVCVSLLLVLSVEGVPDGTSRKPSQRDILYDGLIPV